MKNHDVVKLGFNIIIELAIVIDVIFQIFHMSRKNQFSHHVQLIKRKIPMEKCQHVF